MRKAASRIRPACAAPESRHCRKSLMRRTGAIKNICKLCRRGSRRRVTLRALRPNLTLAYYDAQLAYLKGTLPGEIAALQTQRAEVSRTIHHDIASIRDVYTELFSAVQQLIED